MIKEALISIKNDFSGSVFYWLTFALTSMFMFLFFHLSYSEAIGVTFINSKNNMTTFLSVLVIAVCMVVIFFANDFYIKRKSKEISIQLVCGGTFFQVTKFLLFQTGLLYMLALPLGLFVGICLIPIINFVFQSLLNSNVQLVLSYEALISTFIILAFEILWCTILNLGYSYRSSIKDLLSEGRTQKVEVLLPMKINIKVTKGFHIALFLIPILVMYLNGKDTSAMFFFSILGMIGMGCCFKSVFIPFIDYLVQEKYIDDPLKVVYLGLLRNNLSIMKNNVILLVSSAIILISILVSSIEEPVDVMLSLISFVVINVLLSLAVMFKYSSELSNRKKYFASLNRIGYMESELNTIIKKEVLSMYGSIVLLSFVYIINIFIILLIYRLLAFELILIMAIATVVPLVICGIINYQYYCRIV